MTPLETTTYTFNAVSTLGGTTTSQVTVNVLGPVVIEIISPINNETLYAPQTNITGTVTPIEGYVIEEVGITVNGYPAQVNGNSFFVNNLPLTEGENTITVIATLPDGETSTESITATSDITNSNGWVELTVNPESGIAPLDADLRVELHLQNNLASSSLSSDGPGVVDITQTGDFEYALSFSYLGIYTLTYQVQDDLGNFIEQEIIVNVLDKAALEATFNEKWNNMTEALMNGIVPQAISYFVIDNRSRYEKIFLAMDEDVKHAIFDTITGIEIDSMYDRVARCGAIRVESGGTFSYPVTFVKDQNGIWKIMSF